MIKVRKDLTGQRFGKLVVLYQTEDHVLSNGKRKAKWYCKCDCGNECDVIGMYLMNGDTKSCGCLQTERMDLTGQTFGRLTVLYPADDVVDKRGNHITRWVCECSCEQHNVVTVRTSGLRRGTTQSCGCLSKEKAAERIRELGHQRKQYNKYDLTGEYGIGWTNNTNKEFYFDIEDYNLIKEYCWFETNTGYIQANTAHGNKVDGRGFIKMHRLVTGNQMDWVDHINRNKADNRKENLRECNRSQNGMNRDLYSNNVTGVTGISKRKNNGKYQANIKEDGRSKYLGFFDTKEDAIKARLAAEAKYYGEFVPQRRLFEEYGIDTTPQND